MAVRPYLVGVIGSTLFVSSALVQTPAFAQADGRSAQIVVDADTNTVLYENNAQAPRRPASITKVMTLYLLFDALKKGDLTWDDRISFSRNAANQPPTKLFVGAGNSIPVQTAVEALVLRSANDVATAVAERIGGSETNFARMMTNKARELGMSSTTFRNASGLPNATQRTTAEDLARLAIAIHRDFPEQYHWFSAEQMSYNGQTIAGHNHLMARMPGMDGLKTGYTNASGFNLAATTQRNGKRIVTVVLGGSNRFVRDDLVEALTESAYRELGIGGPQFAANATAYDINFRDSRDAADAAALIMDLPARRISVAGTTNLAMMRNGRQLGFQRGAPTFQVADMTQAAPNRSPSTRGLAREETEANATDEDEADVAVVAPKPAAMPVRVMAAIPNRSTRAFPATVTTPVPVQVQVRVPVAVPVPVPFTGPTSASVSIPLRSTIGPGAAPVTTITPKSKPIEPEPPIAMAALETRSTQAGNSSASEALPTSTGVTQTPSTNGLRGTVGATSVPANVTPVQVASNDPMLTPPEVQPKQPSPSSQVAETAPVVAPVPTLTAAIETSSDASSATVATDAATQMAEVVVSPEAAAQTAPAQTDASPTQMAELALAQQDAAALATASPASASPASGSPASATLNGSINLAENADVATAVPANQKPGSEAAPVTGPVTVPTQMASLATDAVARAQQSQAEANAREQARINEAQAVENTRREAARVQAAAVARATAERLASERRAERQLAEARLKSQKEKDARDAVMAERVAAQERAVAVRDEERRQAEITRARNARGNAVVQVGAFKDRDDANAAITRFARFFPNFSNGEVSAVQRHDGTWYRARFGGLGAIAAREACNLVSGRGGVCAIVGD